MHALLITYDSARFIRTIDDKFPARHRRNTHQRGTIAIEHNAPRQLEALPAL